MKKIHFYTILILAYLLHGCWYGNNLALQNYNQYVNNKYENMFLVFHGNIDIVFGLPSYLTIDYPIVLSGTTLTWNNYVNHLNYNDSQIIKRNDNIENKYGKEYPKNLFSTK